MDRCPGIFAAHMDLLDELQSRILPADGAVGTLLVERGVPLENCLEELCVSASDTVRRVHDDYIAAGARIIETNSFGANAVRLARHGFEHRVSEINWSAAQLARDCARGKGVYVAGSIGPLGISAAEAQDRGIRPAAVFSEQMGALLDGGVQLVVLESFVNLDELLIALEVKHSLHHCPVICSLACNAEGRLPDGTPIADAFARLRAADADVVGLNCVNGPQTMVKIFAQLRPEGLISAFPNAGEPRLTEGRLLYSITPDDFAKAAMELMKLGARLIGGCCGTGPQHIAAFAAALGS